MTDRSNNISPWVHEAALLTIESFDKTLERALAGEVQEEALTKDYDWHRQYPVEQLRERLAQEKEDLKSLSQYTNNTQVLVETLDGYVEEQLTRLFFETNDLPAERLKQDLFKKFVIANVEILSAKGAIDAEQKKTLLALPEIYALGLKSYERLRAEVTNQTNGKFSSLVDWARHDVRDDYQHKAIFDASFKAAGALPVATKDAAEISQQTKHFFREMNKAHKKPRVHKKIDEAAVSQRAQELYLHLLSNVYGVDYPKDSLPHPNVFYLVSEARNVAGRNVLNALPHLERIPEEEYHKRVAGSYVPLMREVNETLAQNATPAGMLEAAQKLDTMRDQAYGVPPNFAALLQQAAKKAAFVAAQSVPRHFEAWEREQKLNWSDGRNLIAANGLTIGTENRVRACLQTAAERIQQALADCTTQEQVCTTMDSVASVMARNAMLMADEPAVLLCMQDYMQAFQQELTAQYRKANLPMQEMKEALECVREKFGYGYRSHQVMQSWCLGHTDGAYDDLGLKAMMAVSGESGRHYSELTEAQKARIPVYSHAYYRETVAPYLPKDIFPNPFLPLLYNACFLRSYREEAKQLIGTPNALFADRVTKDKVTPSLSVNTAFPDAAMDAAFARTNTLFQNAINSFTSSKKEQGMRVLSMPAGPLRDMIEYLEAGQERGRQH